MSPLSPSQLTQRLIDLETRLDELVVEYQGLQRAAAKTKSAAEVAYARAYLASSGPVEERKQIAIADTSEERFATDLADRQVHACREAIRAQHAHIEVARTLSATTRDEMKLGGMGARP